MSLESVNCDICVEPFNKTTRKPFDSPCCPDMTVCRSCVGTWIIGSTGAPSCMGCNTPYAVPTLEAGFTKKFMAEVHEAQAKLFKETQKALLPATQPLVEGVNALEALLQEAREIKAEMARLALRKRMIDRRVYDIRNLREPGAQVEEPEADDPNVPEELRGHREESGRKFLMPCSHAECRGFVSTRYRCGLCEGYTCPRCQKPKAAEDDPDHVCDENDVLSVAEIKRDTKPCPKCGVRIHKLSGCSQMYCTKPGCDTVFDWQTMRIQLKGVVHNAQAIATRARLGLGLQGDNGPCDGPLGAHHVTRVYNRLTGNVAGYYRRTQGPSETLLVTVVRSKLHLEDVDIRRIREDNQDDKLKKLRIKYLQGTLTEEAWTREIRILHRSIRRREDYMGILGGLCELYDDLIRAQLREAEAGRAVDLGQVYELSKLSQEGLDLVSKRFGVKGFQLPRPLLGMAE